MADGDTLCSRVDAVLAPHRMRLGRVRRSALPEVENAGVVTPLDIPESAGLVEWVHLMFFPGNVLGVEFNFFGPRVSWLAPYLRSKVGSYFPSLQVLPLLRHDVLNRVDSLQNIREFRLAIRTSYSETIRAADDALADAIDAVKKIGHPDWVEIVLHPTRYSRSETLGGGLKDRIVRLLRSGSIRENAYRFNVIASEPGLERWHPIDLLEDELITTRQVTRQSVRSRAIDPESAYAAIASAYSELKPQIDSASEALVS